MNLACVVIPIYKDSISENEKKSLRQALTILHKYDIYIVTHDCVKHDCYDEIDLCGILNYEYFDKRFFQGIKGYNELCMSLSFYKRFEKYQYMLIYQLDAWVFDDQLSEWCSKGYDYIGAPWINNDKGVLSMTQVGNGGLSLRKMSYFIKVLSWKLPLMRIHPSGLLSWSLIMYYCGRKNTVRHYQENFPANEDGFFSMALMDSWFPPHKPNCEEAMKFAFEQYPSFLYRKNNGVLPFGCHAYLKYEYMEFWKQWLK